MKIPSFGLQQQFRIMRVLWEKARAMAWEIAEGMKPPF